MSTILIDRRTAALLGELAARPAAAPAVREVRADGRMATGAAGAVATTRRRRAANPSTDHQASVTLRTPRTPGRELSARLQCRPSPVSRTGARRPLGAAAPATIAPAARRARPALHLTRRGRVVALLLLLVVLTVAFSVGRVTSTALGDPSGPAASTVVGRGDTVWSISERIAPDADPRKTAVDLMAVNGLATPDLQVGQTLRLP